ncbi:MAG: TraR/DksA C4-type zinc finger protein [Candidatus Nanopelagicales bacterium]
MATPSAALSEQDSTELRAALARLREENQEDQRRSRETLDDLGRNGLLVDPSMREVSTSAEYLLEDATSILDKIDVALAAMDSGSYGNCTSCGKPIPLGRLRLRPYEPTCVACAK